MFGSGGGPVVNNVLASMTDKIVCATFSADPNLVAEEEEEEDDAISNKSSRTSLDNETSSKKKKTRSNSSSATALHLLSPSAGPNASLALAAAPLLSSDFTFDTQGVSVLKNYSAPNSRRCSAASDRRRSSSTALSLVGDHNNSGALIYNQGNGGGDHRDHHAARPTSISVHSLCSLPTTSEQCDIEHELATANHNGGRAAGSRAMMPMRNNGSQKKNKMVVQDCDRTGFEPVYPLSPQIRHRQMTAPSKKMNKRLTSAGDLVDIVAEGVETTDADPRTDRSVRSAQATPEGTPGRSLSTSRSRINTEDRERFTEEVTV